MGNPSQLAKLYILDANYLFSILFVYIPAKLLCKTQPDFHVRLMNTHLSKAHGLTYFPCSSSAWRVLIMSYGQPGDRYDQTILQDQILMYSHHHLSHYGFWIFPRVLLILFSWVVVVLDRVWREKFWGKMGSKPGVELNYVDFFLVT